MLLDKYAHFKLICQGCGLKATSQRFIIFSALAEARDHPSAERIFHEVAPRLPGLSRDTVYRTLNTLADYGLARKLSLAGGAVRFDGDLSPHHHFMCEACGLIYDVAWPELEHLGWPASVLNLGRPRQAAVVFLGICFHCDPRPGPADPPEPGL